MTREFDSFDAIQTANFGFVVTLDDAEKAEKYAYKTGIEDAIKRVLEIISQERDKTENVTHKTIENIISAVKALKGE